MTELTMKEATHLTTMWKSNLRDALSDFFAHDARATIDFAKDELGLDGSELKAWRDILRGDIITNKIEIYARIFYHTGLPEADPTMVPPQFRQLPNSDRAVGTPRAWDKSKWEEWQKQYQEQYQSSGILQRGVQDESEWEMSYEAEPFDVPVTESSRDVNSLIAQIADKVGAAVTDILLTELNLSGANASDFIGLVRALNTHLEDYLYNEDEGNRDRLLEAYGQDIGALHQMLSVLLDGDKGRRERSLSVNRRIRNG